ncbi:MAG: ABC transporter permease [Firmicutes bacterium]|nr:ABC transporter permease [Bacillota bacterium]
MNKMLHLIKGEILRLVRYKIIFFAVLVSAIWVIIIALSDEATALALGPSLILMDAGLMSVILLGSSFFLEQQEGTLHALLVTPVQLYKVLIAKICSAMFMGFLSLIIVAGSILIFHGPMISILPIIFYTFLVILTHTAIGFLLILHSRDFMAMLVKYMGMVLLFMLPVLLVAVNVVPDEYEFLTLLSPSYAGQVLFQSTVKTVETWKVIFSVSYLALIPGLLYPLLVYKQFVKVAIEG